MKKLLLQTLLLLITTVTYGIEPFNGTFAQAIEKAKKENKDIFIEFTASWCWPCKEFKDKILSEEDVSKVLEDNYIYLSIDVDVPKYANIIKTYGTGGGVPIYTIINSKGGIVNKIKGAILNKDKFLETLAHREAENISSQTEAFNKLIAESISYDSEKLVVKTNENSNVHLKPIDKMIFAKWNPGVSVGLKFSYMSESLNNTNTGYNVDLFVHRDINKFTFQPGINFSSSGGENSEIKLESHNIQIPLAFGIDLFNQSIVTCPQPIKLFITPYGQYTMKTNMPDQFKRWDVGTKASINAELGTFELSVFYDMGFIDQSKLPDHDIFNRSYGVNISMILRR